MESTLISFKNPLNLNNFPCKKLTLITLVEVSHVTALLLVYAFIIVFIPKYLNCRYLWRMLCFYSSLATLLFKSCAKKNYWQQKHIMLSYILDLGNAILSTQKAMSFSFSPPCLPSILSHPSGLRLTPIPLSLS